jgi:hypothetical protein
MLGWFRALMPKQERFFEYFVQHAQVTLVAAEALRSLVSGTGDPLRYCNEVHERELEADELTRNVLTALRRSFITPLDRGDIKDLITSMDDAIDQMNRTATAFGVPVSTTHTIAGAIVGVGAARKVSAVRWNVATDVVIAWVLTMPAAALIGAAFYKLGEYLR